MNLHCSQKQAIRRSFAYEQKSRFHRPDQSLESKVEMGRYALSSIVPISCRLRVDTYRALDTIILDLSGLRPTNGLVFV